MSLITNGLFVNADRKVYGDVTIDERTSPATFTGSGYVVGWPEVEVLSGVYSVAFAVNNGMITYYVSSTDGKLYAGAGAVTLDENGITIEADNAVNSRIKFNTVTTPFTAAYMVGYTSGTTPNRSAALDIEADAESGGTGSAQINISAVDGGGNLIQLAMDTLNGLSIFDAIHSTGMSHLFHYGDYSASTQLSLSTTPATIFTRTIKGNSLGTGGQLDTFASGSVVNNSGAGKTYSFNFNFGGSSLSISGLGSVGTSATARTSYYVQIQTFNDQATGTQNHIVYVWRSPTQASGTLGTPSVVSTGEWTTSEDSTADIAVSLDIVSTASNATQTGRFSAYQLGPYQA